MPVNPKIDKPSTNTSQQTIQIRNNASIVGCNRGSENVYIAPESNVRGPTGPTGPIQEILGENSGAMVVNNPTGSNDLYYTNSFSYDGSDLISNASIIPGTEDAHSLGSASKPWKDIFVSSGTIHLMNNGSNATLGADDTGITHSIGGLAAPFIDIGPNAYNPDVLGGWEVGATGTPGTSNYDLVAIERNTSGPGYTGPYYSLIKGGGPTGPQGTEGNDGPTGPPGIQGNDGPMGPQGVQGNNGPTGPQGIQGNIGPTGPTGAQGTLTIAGTYESDYIYWNATSSAWDVGSSKIHLGENAGQTTQGINTVALGKNAGNTSQSDYGISIGSSAGFSTQGDYGIAIGNNAGSTTQGAFSVAIGTDAGLTTQGIESVAIGRSAGENQQGSNAIAIGHNAGYQEQSSISVAIGQDAGYTGQDGSVAIGYRAGYEQQGSDSIAIGRFAGQTNQLSNSIVLNASGIELNPSNTNSFSVRPIREEDASNVLTYNPTSYEITYSPYTLRTETNAILFFDSVIIGNGGGTQIADYDHSTTLNNGNYSFMDGITSTSNITFSALSSSRDYFLEIYGTSLATAGSGSSGNYVTMELISTGTPDPNSLATVDMDTRSVSKSSTANLAFGPFGYKIVSTSTVNTTQTINRTNTYRLCVTTGKTYTLDVLKVILRVSPI